MRQDERVVAIIHTPVEDEVTCVICGQKIPKRRAYRVEIVRTLPMDTLAIQSWTYAASPAQGWAMQSWYQYPGGLAACGAFPRAATGVSQQYNAHACSLLHAEDASILHPWEQSVPQK